MQVQIFRNDHAKQERDVKAIGSIISYTELHNRPAAIIVLDDGSFTTVNLELLLAAPAFPDDDSAALLARVEEFQVDLDAQGTLLDEVQGERNALKTENAELKKFIAERDEKIAALSKPKKVVPGGKSGVKK